MKKMDPHKKMKLIYSGELLFFAVLFLVFGILRITQAMPYRETRRIVFNWITIFGAWWGIIDIVWALASKKRRTRVCLVDKFLVLPLSIFIITFDFICLLGEKRAETFYILCIGIAFLYITAIYLFQSIYHYFYPIPGLFEDEEEEKKDENSEEKLENSEEKPQN